MFEGAGPDSTILLFSNKNRILHGKDVHHLTVRNIQFKRKSPQVSQGTVVQTGKGFVDIHIEQKYPRIDSIYDANDERGKYVRKFTMVGGECRLVQENNPQVGSFRRQVVSRIGLNIKENKQNKLKN